MSPLRLIKVDGKEAIANLRSRMAVFLPVRYALTRANAGGIVGALNVDTGLPIELKWVPIDPSASITVLTPQRVGARGRSGILGAAE